MPGLAVNIVSWNARGICNSSKQTELRLFCDKYKPDIVAIQETFFSANNNKLFDFFLVLNQIDFQWTLKYRSDHHN